MNCRQCHEPIDHPARWPQPHRGDREHAAVLNLMLCSHKCWKLWDAVYRLGRDTGVQYYDLVAEYAVRDNG